jgi:hypothetical protein
MTLVLYNKCTTKDNQQISEMKKVLESINSQEII